MSSGRNIVDFGGFGSAPKRDLMIRAHHQPGLDWIAPLNEVNEMVVPSNEALLVGAADRQSFGDRLIPHVLGRLLHLSKVRCAGLVSSDATASGAYSVRNYGESLLQMRSPRLKLIHSGGDVLGMSLIEGYGAAVTGEEAERFESLAMISGNGELLRYVQRRTGQISEFAYVLEPEGEYYGAGLAFHAVGLPEPDSLGARKEALLEVLRKAQFVGIRDENGANFLENEGISVERMPCALSVLPQVCARQLREGRDRAAISAIRRRFPNGWIAVETSGVSDSDFEKLSHALRTVSESENLGLVFFSAERQRGRAASDGVRRWVEAFAEWEAAEFASDHLFETASFLLHSRLYCGSCLSSRIVCMSGGVARINVPTGSPAARSYCELWEHDDVPIEFSEEEDWTAALFEALSEDYSLLQEHAAWLHGRYRESFDRFCHQAGVEARLVPGEVVSLHEELAGRRHHLYDEWLQARAGGKRPGLLANQAE